jgi:MFS transporter, DHA2 family, multidrug resistance protein
MATGGRAGWNRWIALAVLSASLLLVGMDMTVLNVAIPTVSQVLAPSRVELLWILDVYSLAVAAFVVSCGTLGDRIGRKRMILSGYATFGLASLASAFSASPAALISARAALGLGAAMVMATTVAVIRVIFTDDRERTLAIGLWSASHSVGAAVGPVLGGYLVERLWWGSVFLINVPVVLVGLVVGLWAIPESRDPQPRRWDLPSAALSVVGVGGLVYGLKQIGGYGIGVAAALVTVLGAVAVALFVLRQRRLVEPLVNLSLFSNKQFSVPVVCILVAFGCTPAMLFLLTQKFQIIDGWSPFMAGLALLPWTAASGVGCLLAPPIAARLGHRGGIALGLGLFAVTIASIALLASTPGYPVLGIVLGCAGLGIGIAMPLASDGLMTAATPERAGEAAAVQETSFELGGGLGIVALGTVLGAVYRAQLPAISGVPDEAAHAASESIGGAAGAAARLPDGLAAALLAAAKEAFTSGYTVAAWVAAGLVAVTTAYAAVLLRPAADVVGSTGR